LKALSHWEIPQVRNGQNGKNGVIQTFAAFGALIQLGMVEPDGLFSAAEGR
jgi:hypothetical protein